MLNQITLHGRVGKTPELRQMSGKDGMYDSVSFTLAVNRDYGDETDWFFCTMNGKRAKVIEKYVGKGSELTVTGRLEKYKGSDGVEHTVVRMTGFDFCGSKKDTREPAQDVNDAFEVVTEQSESIDIPF